MAGDSRGREDWEGSAEWMALRAEGDREAGLARANPDEIWVRARVDEILEGNREKPAWAVLGVTQLLTFDAAAAVLSWSVLGASPVVLLFGVSLSKWLVVAFVTAATHATVSWYDAIGAARL